ncbi:MAG: GtrA family protein [Candidatus Parcubacteria bacterium]|nr:GtrA family protein [Candidatus Parcubacteria bacterium]
METLLIFAKNKIQIIRFLISGGSSAGANLAILYLLTEYAGIHYLQSEIFGFVFGFFITFFLQKFWTFQNMDKKKLPKQMIFTMALAGINFFLNLFFLYALTDLFHFWYFMSEVVIISVLAISNYFIYKNFIFRG